MTLATFIEENRGELDRLIRTCLDRPNFPLDDDEREMWINNDEGLYMWAQSEGVDFNDEN